MKPYFEIDAGVIYQGDALSVLRKLPAESVHCVTTSPPYWGLRDYGVEGQLGLEKAPEEYVEKMVEIFREVRRVLRSDGTLWLNMGDSYAGSGGAHAECHKNPGISKSHDRRGVPHYGSQGNPGRYLAPKGLKPKDLCMIPARVALALQADGWWLRQDIIWSKPNPMPESVTDRCTKSHEYIFLLTKSAKYFYDAEAVKEDSLHEHSPKTRNSRPNIDICGGNQGSGKPVPNPAGGRNKRSVWNVATHPFPEAHFATFPPKLIEPCILAGTSEEGCCPECGSPWERVVESTPLHVDAKDSGNRKDLHGPTYTRHKTSIPGGQSLVGQTNKTIGWKQNCTCNEGYHDGEGHISDNVRLKPKPCTILDPFGGSMTTAIVAYKHGRKFIMVELSETYIKDIGIPRIEKETRQLKLWK